MARIGVYVCHCGLNIAGVVDVAKVAEYAKILPEVVTSEHHSYMCSESGQKMVQEDIRKHKLNRIVVATCSPRMHEETFRKALSEAGLNPYLLEIVNLREQVSWVHAQDPKRATEKAKALVRMGVARARLLEPLEKCRVNAEKSVLVVGGGIAGIQASLDLANAGFKVYLVEKTPSIGGRMAQLDKTFPTLDCSACILTPRMVDVLKHPNINLFTNAEVAHVKGFVGNYEAEIREKPRYVDAKRCVGCESCVKVCPVKIPDKFDENLAERRAVYFYSAHAVPRIAVIDREHCLRLKHGKGVCGKCQTMCETKAIDFEQKFETLRIRVGGIIIAVGSEVFDAAKMSEFGYGRFKNVISSIEFERLSDSSGPTSGKILTPKDQKTPKTIAFIQCVGARDKRFHEYCCRVGCMVTLKQSILAREKINEPVEIYVCYIDLRAFGKGYDEFYTRARDMDINFIAGLPSEVRSDADGSLYFDVYDRSTGKLLEIHPDMLVLQTGPVPNSDLERISSLFHASRSSDGFLLEAHPKLRPLETAMAGVFLAGNCQAPKDIPDTVAQASGAATKAIDLLSSGKIELEPFKAVIDRDLCSGCGICESICPFVSIGIKNDRKNSEDKLTAEVTEAMCQGCGACSGACPTGAIKIEQYSNDQVSTQVKTALVETHSDGGQ